MKLRIYRMDDRNWVVQEFIESHFNEVLGKEIESKWANKAYYGRLSHLINYLIDQSILVKDTELKEQLKEIKAELKRIEQTLVKELEVKVQ